MKELLQAIYPPLLQSWSNEPVVRSTPPLKMGEGVIDEATFNVIEVEGLFDAVNEASTLIGQATLYRSLARPLVSAEIIRAKQDALRELEANETLYQRLKGLVQEAAELEGDFYRLLYGTFLGMVGSPAHKMEFQGFGYPFYKNAVRFVLDLVKKVQELPLPESGYLKTLVEDFRHFADSRAYALMRGPVYRTEKAIRTKAEKGFLMPALKFTPSLFKPVLITFSVIALLGALHFGPLLLNLSDSALGVFWLFLLPLAMTYAPIVGTFDRDACIYPLRNFYKRSEEVQNVLDALGKLDELLAFHRFAKNFGGPTVLPRIIDSDQHVLRVKQVRNPVLAKGNPAYVPNDIDLRKTHLTFITGPNSGGKTAFCKTLAQVQLLAQIGCYVPAEEAELSVADRIFYQVPEISHLTDGEGRFGTELKHTKNIFLATSRKSLVVLDELSEGTTYEEKLETSASILEGFYRKGNNTILITHNHELVDRFQEQKIGLARQVEFAGDAPTYRLIEGISRVSHADRVAKKIGFAKEDIEKYLEEEESKVQ